jgi:hypothetical protein
VKYIFHCFGHENIRARHGKTIEFSKDCELTARGDCIIGVRADFELAAVKKLAGKIRITVEVEGLSDRFYALINPDFGDEREMVFRKSRYNSGRTLGFNLNKGAIGLNREIVQLMKKPTTGMRVTLEEISRERTG